MSCQHVWERRDKQPWGLPYYICTECEMELSTSQYEAIQQARRQGWEQAKRDSIKSVEAMYFRSEDILCGDTIDQATGAIASMEYKMEAKDEQL